MDGVCTNGLLRYISERCSQLQRLRVVSNDKLFGSVLTKAVKDFPQLNELYLFSLFSIHSAGPYPKNYDDNYDIRAIGRSCPMLKSFTFTFRVDENAMEDDDELASEVAEYMPGLRHLSLLGSGITEDGVVAILDGCRHLESLDIRLCINAYGLSNAIKKRCRRQLKQVWLPEDSCSDHEYYDKLDELVSFVGSAYESGYYSTGYGWVNY